MTSPAASHDMNVRDLVNFNLSSERCETGFSADTGHSEFPLDGKRLGETSAWSEAPGRHINGLKPNIYLPGWYGGTAAAKDSISAQFRQM